MSECRSTPRRTASTAGFLLRSSWPWLSCLKDNFEISLKVLFSFQARSNCENNGDASEQARNREVGKDRTQAVAGTK